ncbi:hypothetical protein [Diaphorobacter nitroreducens]|uniref:hypothetical protein n=1 Tax=Diaphorobacter nitroreducens TaxID=164759 RepID=UPI00165141D0|nr:hypothetical protein [Diaphorobacter nitroreducens]
MAIYRITIKTAQARWSITGLFASSCEAVIQTLADWPEARCISARCIRSVQ